MSQLQEDHELKAALVALTRDLVLIPSSVNCPADRLRCFRFIRNHLETLEDVSLEEVECEGFLSLVARPHGVEHPAVLMIGHLDVVALPAGESYASEVHDGRIVGPGAADMKGPLAILLTLFHTFHMKYPGISLGLAVTSDEELGGFHGVRYLVEDRGLRCGIALIPDGGGPREITVEEKGILQLDLRADGRTGHAARPWLAENALGRFMSAYRRLDAWSESLRDESPDAWYPTCALTVLKTDNETVNRIPDRVSASVDIRFPSPYTAIGLEAEVERLLAPDVVVTRRIHADPTILSPDPRFAEIAGHWMQADMRETREAGGSDARFLHKAGIPVIMSRPEVGAIHSAREWIDVSSMCCFYRACEAYLRERLGR